MDAQRVVVAGARLRQLALRAIEVGHLLQHHAFAAAVADFAMDLQCRRVVRCCLLRLVHLAEQDAQVAQRGRLLHAAAGLAVDGQRTVVGDPGLVELAELVHQRREIAQRDTLGGAVADLAVKRQRGVVVRARLGHAALLHAQVGQVGQQHRPLHGVSKLLIQRQRLLEPVLGHVDAPIVMGSHRHQPQCHHLGKAVAVLPCCGKRPHQQRVRPAELARRAQRVRSRHLHAHEMRDGQAFESRHPPAQLGGERVGPRGFQHHPGGKEAERRNLAFTAGQGATTGAQQVVEIQRQQFTPLQAAMRGQSAQRFVSTEGGEVAAVSPFGAKAGLLAHGVALAAGVLVDAQVHAEKRLGDVDAQRRRARPPRPQQTLVDQRLDHVERRRRLAPAAEVQHRFGGFEPEAAFEHRTLCERSLFPRREQVPAPIDRGLQRGLPGDRAAGAGQQREAVLQPCQQLCRRQHARARGGQLQRQRQPVEQAHDLRHHRPAAFVDGKPRLLRAGAHFEQPHRVAAERQRLQRQHLLARQLQALAARDDEVGLRRTVQPASDCRLGMPLHLLEVVQDQQAAPATGDGVAKLQRGVGPAERHAQRKRDCKVDAFGRSSLAQVAERHAARPVAQPGPRVAAHEPGLAHATRPQHGEQARVAIQPVGQFAQLGLAADECVPLGHQVVRHLPQRPPQSVVEHHPVGLVAVRRRRAGGAGRGDSRDLHRLGNALQAVVSVAVDHLPIQGRGIDAVGRGDTEQRAAGLGQRHDPCRQRLGQTVHLDRLGSALHVLGRVLAQAHRPVVHAHARSQAQAGQHAVVGCRKTQCVGFVLEEQEEAIAAVDFAAPMLSQQAARLLVVIGPQLGRSLLAQTLRQRGAVDQVGEYQRELLHSVLLAQDFGRRRTTSTARWCRFRPLPAQYPAVPTSPQTTPPAPPSPRRCGPSLRASACPAGRAHPGWR